MNMYPAYVLTTYEMGTVRLLGETFQVEATFEDDAWCAVNWSAPPRRGRTCPPSMKASARSRRHCTA